LCACTLAAFSLIQPARLPSPSSCNIRKQRIQTTLHQGSSASNEQREECDRRTFNICFMDDTALSMDILYCCAWSIIVSWFRALCAALTWRMMQAHKSCACWSQCQTIQKDETLFSRARQAMLDAGAGIALTLDMAFANSSTSVSLC